MQRVVHYLEDDLDGGEAAETVTFSLDGTSYEIDLNEEHARQLRDSVAGYIEVARRASGRPRARGAGAEHRRARKERLAQIRAWAREHGYEVSDRGRVSAEIRRAYAEAND